VGVFDVGVYGCQLLRAINASCSTKE